MILYTHMQIADLHCDLLLYLEKNLRRTVNDPESQCSFLQMKKGGVSFQTLAIFTETVKGSSQSGAKQFSLFQKLLPNHGTTLMIAIENASGLIEEEEDLELGFRRLERMLHEIGFILYISLTWNQENRFGGGNASKTGLKKDGEALLDFLGSKKIAIDLSHTSDALAYDILNYIDKKGLKIQPIASHSNFRKITAAARNLPDELAIEIVRRKGVIGMNCIRSFMGKDPHDFLKHFEHGIRLHGEKALCFGADFAPVIDFPPELDPLKPFYFPGLDNSSCYPKLLDLLREQFSEESIKQFAHENLQNFLARLSNLKNNAEPSFTAHHQFVGFRGFFKRENLTHGPDACEGAKRHRVLRIDRGAARPASDASSPSYEP